MIQVADVAASSQWYQRTLGLVSGHGGDEFEMLFAGQPHASALVIPLHRWDTSEHGAFGSPDLPVGNGLSLWLRTRDQEAAKEANYPGLNRALAGMYPPGSTWK